MKAWLKLLELVFALAMLTTAAFAAHNGEYEKGTYFIIFVLAMLIMKEK